ncbi:small RNA 2'-O-methyltransferase-like isoform X1 [Ptychodera flava]|uniref:small RNA 2'-O-methyltransferase-like isoform X1 n=1 Tax=Ptychodera flava TaxID=63121 RepID=UPI00396A3455
MFESKQEEVQSRATPCDKMNTSERTVETTSERIQLENEGVFGGPKFNPPLYRQRYEAVINIARKYQTKKVLDMGCSECKLLRHLKNESYIEELCGVDIDESILLANQHAVKPLISDYLHPRDNPLVMRILQGSVTDFDMRVQSFDLVACVELIEHLDPPVLDAMHVTVFHQIHPRVVVITTPNADFNELFPDFTGFRHWDHKFEWSRQEFQQWCNSLAKKYNYAVTYSGIGSGPEGTERLGYCSQMAVFTRNGPEKNDEESPDSDCHPYRLITEAVHPCKKKISVNEEVLIEVQYYARYLSKNDEEDSHESEEEETSSCCLETVSLEILMQFPRLKSLCKGVSELREILEKFEEIQLSEDGSSLVVERHSVESESDNNSSEDYDKIDDSEDLKQSGFEYSVNDIDTEEIWE